MRTKDLKIAVILTAMCLLLSYGFSYSYMHNWFLTQGVMPLVLTVAFVVFVTAVLELPSKAKDYLALPVHGLAWLLLVALDARVSRKLRSSRRKYAETFSHHHA